MHRSLGVRVSFVQSTSMDAWKPVHQRMMELGGNRRFEEFLLQQGIPRETPIREKFLTRAAKWYREDLRAMAEGTERPPPLPASIGHLPVAMSDLYPELADGSCSAILRKRITSCAAESSETEKQAEANVFQPSRCGSACRAIRNLCLA